MVAGGVAAGHRIRLGPAGGDGGANGPFGIMLLIFPNGPCVTLDQPAATGRRDITPSGIMTAPTVSATTTATRPTAGAGGMNGVQLPVIALVTVSKVTAPAAAPATRPVPATNSRLPAEHRGDLAAGRADPPEQPQHPAPLDRRYHQGVHQRHGRQRAEHAEDQVVGERVLRGGLGGLRVGDGPAGHAQPGVAGGEPRPAPPACPRDQDLGVSGRRCRCGPPRRTPGSAGRRRPATGCRSR